MNSVELFLTRMKEHPKKTALWQPTGESTSFEELLKQATRIQAACRENGVGPGDSVLLLEGLGPRLYASVIAVLGLGASVVLVEPWMSIHRIERVIREMKPKLFLTNPFGLLWGLRVNAIRQIPKWLRVSRALAHTSSSGFHTESVEPNDLGIVAFSSGTTGDPKGIVRTQGYLRDSLSILTKHLHLDAPKGSDLCIFATFALVNMANGRSSLLVPPKWSSKSLRWLENIPSELEPESLTCGPAFLQNTFALQGLKKLNSIHVGGALTDCSIFQQGFERWPEAHWLHVYGSSEAEPIALCDARVAVEKSLAKGYFQTLCVGNFIPEVRSESTPSALWVSGPHVCPRYIGNDEENRIYKKTGADGAIWHNMGDRVLEHDSSLWYSGRSQQSLEDFELEQKIYSQQRHSRCFIHSDANGLKLLIGENLKEHETEIKKWFSQIDRCIEARIFRDSRHQARIDRKRSLVKAHD